MTLQQTTAFAKKLITDAPLMFNPDANKEMVVTILTQFLLLYSIECNKEKLEELNPDKLFETIGNICKEDAKTRLGIDI